MSMQVQRFGGHNWEAITMDQPWYIDILTFLVVGFWMVMSFALIQEYGPTIPLLGSVVVVALVGVLVIYGQRLRYLRIGDRFELGLRTPESREQTQERIKLERNR